MTDLRERLKCESMAEGTTGKRCVVFSIYICAVGAFAMLGGSLPLIPRRTDRRAPYHVYRTP